MSGADTWRGIAFQAALTASRAMDVLEGQLGDWLDVDAGADAVDYASGTGHNVVLSGQAKTRAESYNWPPGELAEILKRLIAEAEGADTRLEFITDGQLSRGSSTKLLPALDRAGEGEATQEDWDYLDGYGITPQMADALGRLAVITRYDSPPGAARSGSSTPSRPGRPRSRCHRRRGRAARRAPAAANRQVRFGFCGSRKPSDPPEDLRDRRRGCRRHRCGDALV